MQTTIFTRTLAFAASALLFASACRKTEIVPEQPSALAVQSMAKKSPGNPASGPMEECDSAPYNVTLCKVNNNNNTWTWTWTVNNPTPGNGNGCTLQDLSHWGFHFLACPGGNGPSINDVVSAAYSGNGVNWTSFTPTYQPDPSIGGAGITYPVLKFNYGTNGSANSYYRIVVSRDFIIENRCGAYFKSGSKTGVKEGSFPTMGCGGTTND